MLNKYLLLKGMNIWLNKRKWCRQVANAFNLSLQQAEHAISVSLGPISSTLRVPDYPVLHSDFLKEKEWRGLGEMEREKSWLSCFSVYSLTAEPRHKPVCLKTASSKPALPLGAESGMTIFLQRKEIPGFPLVWPEARGVRMAVV